MKVHFIAIGGSAMHNLAIALHLNGDKVSGSDDEIFEPSLSRLAKYGLLPGDTGWDPERITNDLDAVILGMHARSDNPELKRARELGIRIYSYPEYIYERTKTKIRIVIGGSHGKTSITSMILHVLNFYGIPHDYMVGAQLSGYECMVGFSSSSKFAVIEGDEYLSSPEDRRPKFHLYHPNIALISGIAWDHINVFPTFENYVEQFVKFIDLIEDNGILVYNGGDAVVDKIAKEHSGPIEKIPYTVLPHRIVNGTTFLLDKNENEYPLEIFGDHNLQNLAGAKIICEKAGVTEKDFFLAISSFKGASKRLELVLKNDNTSVFRDFAHSPSKLKATTEAVKKQFGDRKLVACMELHTFSSLNHEFLQHYSGSMDLADTAIVYFNPHTIEHKKLNPISEEEVKEAFSNPQVQVITDSKKLRNTLLSMDWKNRNLLLMSSGTFDGMDVKILAEKIIAGENE